MRTSGKALGLNGPTAPALLVFLLSAACHSQALAQSTQHATRKTDKARPQSITLYGDDGKPRIRLDASGSAPSIVMLQRDGSTALQLQVDSTDHPIIHLKDTSNRVNSTLQIDDKGTHLMMNGPDKARTYVFITDANVSGMVMQDGAGVRRFDLIRSASGDVALHRYDASGKAIVGETPTQGATPARK